MSRWVQFDAASRRGNTTDQSPSLCPWQIKLVAQVNLHELGAFIGGHASASAK